MWLTRKLLYHLLKKVNFGKTRSGLVLMWFIFLDTILMYKLEAGLINLRDWVTVLTRFFSFGSTTNSFLILENCSEIGCFPHSYEWLIAGWIYLDGRYIHVIACWIPWLLHTESPWCFIRTYFCQCWRGCRILWTWGDKVHWDDNWNVSNYWLHDSGL